MVVGVLRWQANNEGQLVPSVVKRDSQECVMSEEQSVELERISLELEQLGAAVMGPAMKRDLADWCKELAWRVHRVAEEKRGGK